MSAGLSQRALGILAGIDESVASTRLNRYELEVHAPDHPVACRIAQALNVPTCYLFTEDDELAALLVALHRAPAGVQKKVRSLLKVDL